jgi:hypothetical protein
MALPGRRGEWEDLQSITRKETFLDALALENSKAYGQKRVLPGKLRGG